MQLTNNYYYRGYIKSSPSVGVPKDLSCSKTADIPQKEESKIAFKGSASGAVSSLVASGMYLVRPQIKLTPSIQKQKEAVQQALDDKNFDSKTFFDELNTDLDSVVKKMNAADITAADFIDAVNNTQSNDFASDLTELIKSIEVAKDIKNINGLDAFPLSLSDINQIRQYSADYNYSEFENLLFKLNDVHNVYSEDEFFELISDSDLYKIGESVNAAAEHAVQSKIPDENRVEININGREKFITLYSGLNINKSPKNIPDDAVACMIKSNLVTQELFDACNEYGKIEIPEQLTSKVKLPGGKTIESTVNMPKLFDRLNQKGIESLTSHEVHVLTDFFDNEYKNNADLKKIVDKTVQQSRQAKVLYGISQELRKAGSPIAAKNGVEVDDHFYMRMIDRDLISPVDFSLEEPKLLTFEETLEKVIQNVKSVNQPKNKDNIKIGGLNGDGVNVLFETDKDSRKQKIISIM